MNLAVTGSIATDHLMRFPGLFVDSLMAEKLDRVSLSFLVDELEVRRGGVAANIAFGMACWGCGRCSSVPSAPTSPTTGPGWTPRRRHRLGTCVRRPHTARFICTTDDHQNQIASFYAGAMSEARDIELKPVSDRVASWTSC